MMWWYMTASRFSPNGGWWAWHMLAGWLLWAAFVALAVLVVLRVAGSRRGMSEYQSQDAGILCAETILQERYARGEIGREEFLEKQRDLSTPV